MIPRSVCKRILKQATDNKFNISKEAVDYAGIKIQEFAQNLAKNSIPLLEEQGMKTLMQRHLEKTLDSLALALKNLPKAEISNSVEKEAGD